MSDETELVNCSRCGGRGKIMIKGSEFSCMCSKCLGKGKIDWIEQIVGIKLPRTYFGCNPYHTRVKSLKLIK